MYKKINNIDILLLENFNLSLKKENILCTFSSKIFKSIYSTIIKTIPSCSNFFDKPCHCDCFFRRKTRLVVSLFKFIPRCPYYCKFFAFRRTGVHPPLNFTF